MTKQETLSAQLQDANLEVLDEATKAIAKRSKKKRLSSGTMFHSEFCDAVALELLKPANKEVLKTVKRNWL